MQFAVFANDIDLLGGSEEELQRVAEMLEKTALRYGMEISSDIGKNSRQEHQTMEWTSQSLSSLLRIADDRSR